MLILSLESYGLMKIVRGIKSQYSSIKELKNYYYIQGVQDGEKDKQGWGYIFCLDYKIFYCMVRNRYIKDIVYKMDGWVLGEWMLEVKIFCYQIEE